MGGMKIDDEYRWRFLPYAVERVGKEPVFVLLNRQYKPLGCNPHRWYKDLRYPEHAVRIQGLTPKVAERIAYDGRVVLTVAGKVMRFWLYNDGCTPCTGFHAHRYFERLARLMALKMSEAVKGQPLLADMA